MVRLHANALPAPPGGNNLLLGWQPPHQRSFGFAPADGRRADDEEALSYDRDAHLITVAPTRSGKGRGVIVPNLLHYAGPVIVLDPKGENYQVTARCRRQMGQTVVKLDPFHVVDAHTGGLNPLDMFGLPGGDLVTDAQMLSGLLATGNRNTREPFWDLNGGGLITGVIAYVASVKEPAQRNLNEVCKTLTADDVVYNLAVVLDTVGKRLNKTARQEIATFLQMPDVTRGGVLATAGSYFKPLLSERVEATLEQSSFPLADVVEGKPLSIYLIIPPDKLQSHMGLLRLWVGTLLKAITSRTEAPELRTLFLLDECGQLGNFPFLETMITLSAGYGVWCWSFWQDLAQMRSAYPTSWENILNNCGVVQTFGIEQPGDGHAMGPIFAPWRRRVARAAAGGANPGGPRRTGAALPALRLPERRALCRSARRQPVLPPPRGAGGDAGVRFGVGSGRGPASQFRRLQDVGSLGLLLEWDADVG